MVSNVRPKASATPAKPMPKLGKAPAKTALPHPPNTSQNVPKNSAPQRLPSDMRSLLRVHWATAGNTFRFCRPRVRASQHTTTGANACLEVAAPKSERVADARGKGHAVFLTAQRRIAEIEIDYGGVKRELPSYLG